MDVGELLKYQVIYIALYSKYQVIYIALYSKYQVIYIALYSKLPFNMMKVIGNIALV